MCLSLQPWGFRSSGSSLSAFFVQSRRQMVDNEALLNGSGCSIFVQHKCGICKGNQKDLMWRTQIRLTATFGQRQGSCIRFIQISRSFFYLAIHPSIHPFIHINLSIRPFIHSFKSPNPFFYLANHLSIHPFILRSLALASIHRPLHSLIHGPVPPHSSAKPSIHS